MPPGPFCLGASVFLPEYISSQPSPDIGVSCSMNLERHSLIGDLVAVSFKWEDLTPSYSKSETLLRLCKKARRCLRINLVTTFLRACTGHMALLSLSFPFYTMGSFMN